MSVVSRGWFIPVPGQPDRMDYFSVCLVCGALVLDGSADGQSTWQRHMDYHSPEERKAAQDELQRDRVGASAGRMWREAIAAIDALKGNGDE